MIKKRLELLEQLQEIDLQVDLLHKAQNVCNAEIQDIEKLLSNAMTELAGLQERQEQLTTEKTAQEASLSAEQENILRSETNMKEIKTNKEFQAVGREITSARKEVTVLEEQIIQVLSQLEEITAEIVASEGRLEALKKNCDTNKAEKQVEIDKLQQDISVDAMRRESIAKELPENLVKRYETLRANRMGKAVVIARDGYCLGCNMQIPPQMYNNLYKYEELITCPHCQRVLILKLQQTAL